MDKVISEINLKPIKSSLKNDFGNIVFAGYNELESFLSENFKGDGFVILYLDYKVIIRKYNDGRIIFMENEKPFNPEFIQKLRLFNPKQELFIWRTEGKWKARLRKDEEGEDVSVVEANQILFGTTGIIENGYTKLIEDRGTEVILPFEITGIDEKKNRVKIKTRNYIEYNELGQAGYIDSRFIEFTIGVENKILGGKDNG